MKNKKTIVIIPARGGSKGIPRKNLRPINGKPLLFYSIQASLNASKVDKVIVSTDDEEIKLFAERFGAEVIIRPENLSTDEVPIDPVVIHAVKVIEETCGETYENIITIQPTAPLITSEDIDNVICKLDNKNTDTVISVCEDKHLRWIKNKDDISPDYKARVNRQLLPDAYKETGAIIACKKKNLYTNTRIGKKIDLYIIELIRSIDIDTYSDLWLCELLLKRKKIVIAVTGNQKNGMGHVYRTIMLAHELIRHEIIFICRENDSLAADYINKQNYIVEIVPDKIFLNRILSQNPDMVINDLLDTTSDYILALKKNGIIVINFEDMGMGAEVADLVINALYPHQIPQNNILVGSEYFCLRDEFIHIDKKNRASEIKNILLTFGGVDEGNLTCRILKILHTMTLQTDTVINVVLGPGYIHYQELNALKNNINSQKIRLINNTNTISDYMNQADLAITSAGRTVFELASLVIPTVVISQNLRETTHTFASSEYGFINLGLRSEIDDELIKRTLLRLFKDEKLRDTMIEKMKTLDLRSGKKRVIELINNFLR